MAGWAGDASPDATTTVALNGGPVHPFPATDANIVADATAARFYLSDQVADGVTLSPRVASALSRLLTWSPFGWDVLGPEEVRSYVGDKSYIFLTNLAKIALEFEQQNRSHLESNRAAYQYVLVLQANWKNAGGPAAGDPYLNALAAHLASVLATPTVAANPTHPLIVSMSVHGGAAMTTVAAHPLIQSYAIARGIQSYAIAPGIQSASTKAVAAKKSASLWTAAGLGAVGLVVAGPLGGVVGAGVGWLLGR